MRQRDATLGLGVQPRAMVIRTPVSDRPRHTFGHGSSMTIQTVGVAEASDTAHQVFTPSLMPKRELQYFSRRA